MIKDSGLSFSPAARCKDSLQLATYIKVTIASDLVKQ